MNEQQQIEKNNDKENARKAEPLVTFALFAYNQEEYIREAVEAALAQTYENLEIVISDDKSPDKTFEIMQEIVAGYTGPHKIILNRNESNLGLSGHVNKVFEMSKGEIIVIAAGDDVSDPQRSRVIVDEFVSRSRDTMVVWCSGWEMNENGVRTGKIERTFNDDFPYDIKNVIKRARWVLGATVAVRRELMTKFGPMNEDVANEDHVILNRAILIGRLAYTDKCLVDYRRVSQSLSDNSDKVNYYMRMCAVSRQLLSDLNTNSKKYGKFIPVAKLRLAKNEFNYLQWKTSKNMWTTVFASIKMRSPNIIRQYMLAMNHHRKVASRSGL
jgi:glycosyltransferase involved in cell wall biosynthesis